MSIKKKLKDLIPSKRAFDEACATAEAECPQREYREYRDYGTVSPDFSREDLLRFWAKNDKALWKSGYYEYLPADVLAVFAWWKRW